MSRHRFGVALLVPEPWATEIDGLRRALGDRQRERIAPHITLVPPVNVRDEDLPQALRNLRAAAAGRARIGPLLLTIGPPAGFHPVSDTLYLGVAGAPAGSGNRSGDGSGDGLAGLRDAVFVAPLARSLDHAFVPHVTIADAIDERRAAEAGRALQDFVVDVEIDRLHLLEEQRDETGRRRWVPVADHPFARPAIVGRGGIELELTTTTLVDPEAMVVLARPPAPVPAGAGPVVVTARRSGAVAGVLVGWQAGEDREITALDVPDEHRGQGISRQLRLAFAAT